MKIVLRINMMVNAALSPLGLMALANEVWPVVRIVRRPVFTRAQMDDLRKAGCELANENADKWRGEK